MYKMDNEFELFLEFLSDWSRATLSDMKSILSRTGKGNSNLIKNIELEINRERDGVFTVELFMPEYGIFVDKGRKPGKQPPIKDIRDWCRKKGIEKSAAFPIARKIGRDGIKPTNFTNPMFDNLGDLIKEIEKQYAEAIVETIVNTIETKNK